MPEMDGYEVCRRIRATPQTEALPVIMITASGRDEKRRALEAGADDFLMKPFDQASCWPASARCFGSSGTTTRSSSRRPSWLAGTASSKQRVESQVAEIEPHGATEAVPLAQRRGADRLGGRRVVPREPPPRDHGRVLRPARLHDVRRDGRARGD